MSLLIACCAALLLVLLALAINYVIWRLKSRFSRMVFGLGLGPFYCLRSLSVFGPAYSGINAEYRPVYQPRMIAPEGS